MSPRAFSTPASKPAAGAVERFWATLAVRLRDGRTVRGWSVAQLARRAGTSRSLAYLAEAGSPTSIEAVVRLALALGLRLEGVLVDPRQRRATAGAGSVDLVHSAMGEIQARHLRGLGFAVGVDEPYQHYQFAGRADVVAWDLGCRALLHIENRTRFPDLQDTAGTYNAKRAYLAAVIGERLGVRRWSSQTHVLAGRWSSEVLHVLRLRTATFHAICPDPPDAFEAWWRGAPPGSGASSSLIVLDPMARGRQRAYVGLQEALRARPRSRGYADAATHLTAQVLE
jgi:transcriptional regulator with XRE-family HTH domain